MMIFEVGGLWTESNTPMVLIGHPHPSIISCDNVSGSYPPHDPNIGIWVCRAELAVVDAIATDPEYVVFWSEIEDEA